MANRGPMVRVELEPGRWVQMYREDAVAQGLVQARSPKKKRRKPARDKMRVPEGEKAPFPKTEPGPEPEPEPVPDDLTEIPGVGPSIAAVLHEAGIFTFEQAREADADTLNPQARRAIEVWRGEGG